MGLGLRPEKSPMDYDYGDYVTPHYSLPLFPLCASPLAAAFLLSLALSLSTSTKSSQVSPGAAMSMRILEDFIHLIGDAQKPFQSVLVVTNNLSEAPVVLVPVSQPCRSS